MKNYELIETEGSATLRATLPDETVMWIPTDPANGDYAEYLRYTAWVEAGNKPEDFWTADTMSAEKEKETK
jgi:hypothetical protein